MSKMLLAVGFLIGVNIVSGCDKNIQYDQKYVFSEKSDAVVREFEYDRKNNIMVCRNMIPEDFEKCAPHLDSASIVKFENCDLGDGVSCIYAWKLIFTNCKQIEEKGDVYTYVGLLYHSADVDIIIDE